jgi:hypothetical protein
MAIQAIQSFIKKLNTDLSTGIVDGNNISIIDYPFFVLATRTPSCHCNFDGNFAAYP